MEAVDTQVPTDGSEKARHFAKLSSLLRTVFLALLVTVVSYLAAWVGVSLFVSHETTAVSAFYPGEAVLVSVLLLVSRPIWPWLILAGVVGWVLATLQIGAKPTALFFVVMSAGAAEALIAALGL